MSQLSNRALTVYCIASAVLFGSWMVIEFNRGQVSHPDQLIGYIQNTLAALAGHIFTLINSSPTLQPPPLGVIGTAISIPQSAPTIVTKE